MSELDEFLRLLHPNKKLDEIKIDNKLLDKVALDKPLDKVALDKPKSRKEKRFIERNSKKPTAAKPTSKPVDLKLAKIKADTKIEIGKRLDPIIFGIR